MEVARLSESLAFRSCLIRQFQQGYTVSYAYVLTWFSCVWVSTISSYCPPNAYFFSVFCTCFAWVLFSVFLFAKHWTVRLRKERGTWFFLAWWKPRRVAPSPFELHPKTQFNVMIIILISSRHKSPQNVLTPFFCYRSLFFFFFLMTQTMVLWWMLHRKCLITLMWVFTWCEREIFPHGEQQVNTQSQNRRHHM